MKNIEFTLCTFMTGCCLRICATSYHRQGSISMLHLLNQSMIAWTAVLNRNLFRRYAVVGIRSWGCRQQGHIPTNLNRTPSDLIKEPASKAYTGPEEFQYQFFWDKRSYGEVPSEKAATRSK